MPNAHLALIWHYNGWLEVSDKNFTHPCQLPIYYTLYLSGLIHLSGLIPKRFDITLLHIVLYKHRDAI